VTLYCATSNRGKLDEFRLAARRFRCHVEPLPVLEQLGACPEDGSSFQENAIQKALYYGEHARGYLFADDSGLVVDALDGAPGIRSARFAGPSATDEQNNRLLLEKMLGRQDRRARFVCVVALARDGAFVRAFEGSVEGTILEEPRGTGGFGYDPLFYYPAFGCTLAEVAPKRKLEVSHRGRALAAMYQFLAEDSR
jgi:XTP/dITP diphosphohydrolase